MPKELYLLGLGVKPSDHATVEVLQAAGLCSSVYAQGLDKEQELFLGRFCSPGALRVLDRSADEEALAARILKETALGRRVAFAAPGHPFYWSGLAGRLISVCARRKLAWRTFGSVSPMGLAIAQLGVTLGTTIYGLQSFDYAAVASRAVLVNKAWPLVVYFYSPFARGVYEKAFKELSRIYPEGHPVHWCEASQPPRLLRFGALRSLGSPPSTETVFYLPAARSPRSRLGRTEHHAIKGRKEAASWVKD